jgi:hypothetical protein
MLHGFTFLGKKLHTELQAQIKKLQQQAEQVRKDEIASAIADIKAKMQEYGITVDDLGSTRKSKPVRKYNLRSQRSIVTLRRVRLGQDAGNLRHGSPGRTETGF